jgi:hypothetical protein
MYVLYEHHVAADGSLLATDFLMTSTFPGPNKVHFWNNQDKAVFNYVKDQIFKNIPVAKRSMDPTTYIWSFFDDAGKMVYDQIKADTLTKQFVFLERVVNLEAQSKAGSISRPTAQLDPEEFFYNKAGSGSKAPVKQDIVDEIVELINLELCASSVAWEMLSYDEQKKLYRRAAIRLHPDRNNGDGSKMSTLNMLWQQWQQFAQTTVTP